MPPNWLDDDQLYALERAVWDTDELAITFTAIALRESAGNQYAYNWNPDTKDNSYGLHQIDWDVPGVRNVVGAKVLGDKPVEALFNGHINANAAKVLSNNGDPALIAMCWYINRKDAEGNPINDSYQQRYEAMLPRARAAAARANAAKAKPVT
jgi:hypothetical protein